MKKNKTELHSCKECSNAYLMRSAPYNPIVAECKKTGERQVATMPLHCLYFEQKKGDAEIHPMLCYDKDR